MRETPSPIDLPEPDERRGLLWTSFALAVAALLLLLTNGVSLRDWIDDQTPGPFQARAAELADRWVELTDRVGLGQPRALMHHQWKRAEAARFQEVRR